MVVNKYEDQYDDCTGCRYVGYDEGAEPCVNCIHAITFSDPRYENAPSYYVPYDIVEDVEDIVNHPSHYTNGGMECIDEMMLVFGKRVVADFCLCNAWKYRYRALSKNGQEDIDKSHWYMAKYKEIMDEVRDYDESI